MAGTDLTEESVGKELAGSAAFGADCADAGVAQAIACTKARAVAQIFTDRKTMVRSWSLMVSSMVVTGFWARMLESYCGSVFAGPE